MKTQNVLHIVLNDFKPDYRVLKETTALQKAGYDVTLFALWSPGFPKCETIDDVVVRRFYLLSRCLPKKNFFQLFKFMECIIRMVWVGVKTRPCLVHAHDLSGLVVGYVIAQVTKCLLIYDSHELHSKKTAIVDHSSRFRKLLLGLERVLAKRANRVITVSEGIARELAILLHIPVPVVLRNVPERFEGDTQYIDLRNELKISSKALIFIYIGSILPERGVDLILKAFGRLPNPEAYLVFLGVSELPAWLKFQGLDEILNTGRVFCYPPVHPRKVVSLARSADVGVHAIRGTSENHRLCLPNKLFEYIQAGLAVLVTDLPEMTALVQEKHCGCVFRDGDELDLYQKMSGLLENRSEVEAMKLSARIAAEDLHWGNEQKKLIDLYAELLK